jgi:hypothetical protein
MLVAAKRRHYHVSSEEHESSGKHQNAFGIAKVHPEQVGVNGVASPAARTHPVGPTGENVAV